MARYTGPRTKVSRRARQLLDENKARYYDRRPYPPGEHGRGRIRESQYQIQLREKQKVRHIYGVLEKQFRRYYKEANRQSGITGTNLLRLLESRLDNVIFSPHLGGETEESRQNYSRMCTENVLAVLRGERPPHIVNSDVLGRLRQL